MNYKMKCVNCNREFEKRTKGFKRKPLLSKERPEEDLKQVLDLQDLTPKVQKDERYFCEKCEKLVASATTGEKARQALFKETDERSYVARKRKLGPPTSTPAKKAFISYTPTSKQKQKRITLGARYFNQYQYKQGFKHYIKKSKAAYTALRKVISQKTTRDMRNVFKTKILPNMRVVSLENFKKMNFSTLINELKDDVPLLHDVVVAAMKKTIAKSDTQTAVLGMILAMVTAHSKPRKASLLQKMISVQMWRSGCKRTLFTTLNRLGICMSDQTTYKTLDTLKTSFDKELLGWKLELQRIVFPEATETIQATTEDPSSAISTSDENPSLSSVSQFSESFAASPTSSLASLATEEQSAHLDMSLGSYEVSVSPTANIAELDDLWEDISDDDDADATIRYAATIPPGYTLCWDNVGKQVKARRHTRNHGNQYKNWALAFAVKNRIATTQFKDLATVLAEDIPMQTFYLTHTETEAIRDKMTTAVQHILGKYLTMFLPVAHLPVDYTPHVYDKESCDKSEMFNIGVMDENPSSTAGVINIIEKLHHYVPKNDDGSALHPLICWGDGLSCERHVDAQNARANGNSPLAKLQGLEPGAQEFHKRMLLLQDMMDAQFSGKSAMDKGTLYHIKNIFNQRSVNSNVHESFNYVSDFIKFTTEGYVILMSMDILHISSLDDVADVEDLEVSFAKTAEQIVNNIWLEPTYQRTTVPQEQCFCKQECEDDVLVECDNEECPEGQWFHLECVGLQEDNIPPEWYCTLKCRETANQYCYCHKNVKGGHMVECGNGRCQNGKWFHFDCVGLKRSPKKDEDWYCSKECSDVVRKGGDQQDCIYQYSKALMWGGLSDIIRRQAVRYNDGPMLLTFWKRDILQFLTRNHTKYFVLAHRLIVGTNGFLQERLRQDLIWNRTVNMRGGRGCNDETDLVNEFLNREFKDSIRQLGGQTTESTLERHGKLAGGLGKVLDAAFGSIVDQEGRPTKRTIDNRRDDMTVFVETLKSENLTSVIPGRRHSAFPGFDAEFKINVNNLEKRINKLSKKLDRARRVANQ